jgi:hypothetical protein
MTILLVLNTAYAQAEPKTWMIDWPLNDSGSQWTHLKAAFGYFYPLDNVFLVPTRQLIQKLHEDQGLPTVQKVSLWASWPGMGIPVAKTSEDFHGHAGSNTMFVRLQSGKALQFWAHTWLENQATVCRRPDRAKTHSDLICRPRSAPLVRLGSEYGLHHLGIDAHIKATTYRAGFYNDVYYAPDLGDALATFIRCSDDENHPLEDEQNLVNASCEQIFLVPSLGATVRVGYNGEYLKDWKAIQQAWLRQLQSFVQD